MFPFTYRFAARAPCDSKGSGCPGVSVESIQPRPPQPCEVGRPKGRRRKNRRQSHTFFLAPAAPYSDCTENCPLRPCEHPAGFEIRIDRLRVVQTTTPHASAQ